MIKAKVTVTLKKEVSDVQGITVQQTISQLDFPEVRKVRVGRYFELELDGDAASVKEKLERVCNDVFSNPVIEEYHYEIVEE